MIIKAWYSSKEEIPQGYEALYHSKNGRWEFNGDEAEGVAELLNPALDAKKQELLQKVVDSGKQVTDLTKERDDALRELSTLKRSGTKVISEDEDKQFTEYKNLGPVKDLKNLKTQYETTNEELTKIKSEADDKKFAEEVGLDYEAYRDLKNSERGKNLKFSKKTIKVDDPKDSKKKIEQEVAIVEIEDENKKIQEFELSEWSEKNLPKYQHLGLFASSEDNSTKDNKTQKPRLPFNSMKRSKNENAEEEIDSKKKVKTFNQQRNSRPSLFGKREKEVES